MTDKEKIKAEIERLIKENNGSPISVCNDLLYFIDSLPEEPVSDDWKAEMNRYLESNGMFIDTDNRKVKRYNGDSVDNIWDYEDIARYFVNWQKRQFEKNRLAACDKQTPEEAQCEMDFVMSIIEKEHRYPTFDDAIKYGMKVQKELMMKDVVVEHWDKGKLVNTRVLKKKK